MKKVENFYQPVSWHKATETTDIKEFDIVYVTQKFSKLHDKEVIALNEYDTCGFRKWAMNTLRVWCHLIGNKDERVHEVIFKTILASQTEQPNLVLGLVDKFE